MSFAGNFSIRTSSIFTAVVFASASARADCDSNFSKQGSIFTGAIYRSNVAIADVSVESAIEQLRAKAILEKMSVLSSDAASGSLLIEQRESGATRVIPMLISATNESGVTSVAMEVKLASGMLAKADDVRAEICGMLSAIKVGTSAEQAAAAARMAAENAAPESMDALDLSMQLARQAHTNQSTINPRYRGQRFTLSGKVGFIMEDGDGYNIGFDIPDRLDMAISPGPNEPSYNVRLSCLMAPSELAYALSLRERERVKLTGVFYKYDQFKKTAWLKDCKRAR